ncbi:polyadenylate-binding protein 4-like [Salvia divinorum]|uniref:Polyadenylate-binding protein 4-like n=1 Tax=Salvia divinorum TaxID=28513 RepID=A0ABD1HTH6_SALDI
MASHISVTNLDRPVRVKDMICDYGAVNSGRHLKGQQASKLHKPFKPVWDYTSNLTISSIVMYTPLDNCFYEWTYERRSLNSPEVAVSSSCYCEWILV